MSRSVEKLSLSPSQKKFFSVVVVVVLLNVYSATISSNSPPPSSFTTFGDYCSPSPSSFGRYCICRCQHTRTLFFVLLVVNHPDSLSQIRRRSDYCYYRSVAVITTAQPFEQNFFVEFTSYTGLVDQVRDSHVRQNGESRSTSDRFSIMLFVPLR